MTDTARVSALGTSTSTEDHLVHFTSNIEDLVSILLTGRVEARNEFGFFPVWSAVGDRHLSACFTELPIGDLHRVARAKGKYGIAVSKSFAKNEGAQEVIYLDLDSRDYCRIEREIAAAKRAGDVNADAWNRSPFISPNRPNYKYEYEKEWRVPGGLQFSWSDILFVSGPDGAELTFTQDPELGAVTWDEDADQFRWWGGYVEEIDDAMNMRVDSIRERFAPGDQYLFLDREEPTGFNWTGFTQWSGLDIVLYFHDELVEEAANALAAHLEFLSPIWIDKQQL
ncbi:hypothetical protein [Cryobacterium lyxosi]|uniref:Uncharacterized protein n=1 Tax=Cryobacterium lyxosi TaxID=1259228 RepID=A0A4R8ZJN9_9MICO|nr:hypothetical protein [Cryobacterium lyxosi]TFD27755.1 hypothetical protein E3T27_04665 [Cryobacterium lyxosi]